MSYQSVNDHKEGAISGSAADPVTWNVTGEEGRAVMVLTVTASVNCNLYYREARTDAELAAPPQSLPHQWVIPLVANVSQRITVARDPSLPVGKAWLADGSGTYVLDGGRRAHS